MSEIDRIPRLVSVVQNDSGLTVVEYRPDQLLENLPRTKLIVAKDLPISPSIEQRLLEKLEKYKVEFNGSKFSFYPDKGIKFHESPEPGSPGSLAKYLIFDEATGIFVHELKGHTSCNYHTLYNALGSEGHYNVSGKVRVCRCLYNDEIYEGYIDLRSGVLYYVKPGECHISEASTPAVNIGLMLPGVGRRDHHYPERCIKKLLQDRELSLSRSHV